MTIKKHIIEVIRYRGKAVSAPQVYVYGHLFRIDRKAYLVTTPRLEELDGQTVIPQMYLTEIIEKSLEIKIGGCNWYNIQHIERIFTEEEKNIEIINNIMNQSTVQAFLDNPMSLNITKGLGEIK